MPLFVGGHLIGGAGASGGTSEQDEECVTAAALSMGFGVGREVADEGKED